MPRDFFFLFSAFICLWVSPSPQLNRQQSPPQLMGGFSWVQVNSGLKP